MEKLGRDFRGDPASALMEILDPSQNVEFHDNYLDLSFDLSKVFFITTANTLDHIPGPLLDRMEILRLAGYSDEEKREIARRYLLPRRLAEAGVPASRIEIPDETLNYVVARYTREAGVRELERMLGRIVRKITTRFVEIEGKNARAAKQLSEPAAAGPSIAEERVSVKVTDLDSLLGPERFFLEKARRESNTGIAAGLSWTEAGGEVLFIEAVLLPTSGTLLITGQLGEVMRESALAARS